MNSGLKPAWSRQKSENYAKLKRIVNDFRPPEGFDSEHSPETEGFCYLSLYEPWAQEAVGYALGPYPTIQQIREFGMWDESALFTVRKTREGYHHLKKGSMGFRFGALTLPPDDRLGLPARDWSEAVLPALVLLVGLCNFTFSLGWIFVYVVVMFSYIRMKDRGSPDHGPTFYELKCIPDPGIPPATVCAEAVRPEVPEPAQLDGAVSVDETSSPAASELPELEGRDGVPDLVSGSDGESGGDDSPAGPDVAAAAVASATPATPVEAATGRPGRAVATSQTLASGAFLKLGGLVPVFMMLSLAPGVFGVSSWKDLLREKPPEVVAPQGARALHLRYSATRTGRHRTTPLCSSDIALQADLTDGMQSDNPAIANYYTWYVGKICPGANDGERAAAELELAADLMAERGGVDDESVTALVRNLGSSTGRLFSKVASVVGTSAKRGVESLENSIDFLDRNLAKRVDSAVGFVVGDATETADVAVRTVYANTTRHLAHAVKATWARALEGVAETGSIADDVSGEAIGMVTSAHAAVKDLNNPLRVVGADLKGFLKTKFPSIYSSLKASAASVWDDVQDRSYSASDLANSAMNTANAARVELEAVGDIASQLRPTNLIAGFKEVVNDLQVNSTSKDVVVPAIRAMRSMVGGLLNEASTNVRKLYGGVKQVTEVAPEYLWNNGGTILADAVNKTPWLTRTLAEAIVAPFEVIGAKVVGPASTKVTQDSTQLLNGAADSVRLVRQGIFGDWTQSGTPNFSLFNRPTSFVNDVFPMIVTTLCLVLFTYAVIGTLHKA